MATSLVEASLVCNCRLPVKVLGSGTEVTGTLGSDGVERVQDHVSLLLHVKCKFRLVSLERQCPGCVPGLVLQMETGSEDQQRLYAGQVARDGCEVKGGVSLLVSVVHPGPVTEETDHTGQSLVLDHGVQSSLTQGVPRLDITPAGDHSGRQGLVSGPV